jgi:hypothetical protein
VYVLRVKTFVALSWFLFACSSGSSNSGSPSGACPDLAATWTITSHCVSSFVGQTVAVTQNSCSLAFASPFDGYSGTVASDSSLHVTGPTATGTQDCTGTATTSSIDLSCPGPCQVTLMR